MRRGFCTLVLSGVKLLSNISEGKNHVITSILAVLFAGKNVSGLPNCLFTFPFCIKNNGCEAALDFINGELRTYIGL